VRINNEESCTFQEIMYGEMVFADFNEIGADPYLLTLLEVGDGVMKGEMIDSCNTQELPWGSPEAWLGATAVALDEVNDSDYYTDEFVAAELVDDATKPTISFPDGSWDCGSVEDEEFVIDFGAQVDAGTNIEDMCGHYNIGHDDINCSGCTMDSDCGEGQFCFYGVCLTLEGNEVGIDANSDCSESGCGGEAEACLSYFYPTCQSMCWDIETGSTKAEELAGLSIMDEEACSENSGGTWAEAAPGQYVCQPNDTVMCEAEE